MFVICLSGGLEPKTPHFEFIWIGLIPGMGPYRGCLFNAIFRQLLALSIAHLGKKANAFLCRLLSYKHKKKNELDVFNVGRHCSYGMRRQKQKR